RPQSGDAEDGLDDHDTAQQGRRLQPEDRDDRDGRVAQDVLADQPAAAGATGTGGQDVGPGEHVDHTAAGLPGDLGRHGQGQGEGGQDDVPQPVAESLLDGHVTGGGQPAEI